MNTMNTSNPKQIIRAHLYLLQNVHPRHHLWDTEMLCIRDVLTAQSFTNQTHASLLEQT